jgi:flagellar assembly factor FliW
MPQILSKFFGTVNFEDRDLFHFPQGIPGFEGEKKFIGVEIPDQGPVLYLQSAASQDLCLITLPVRACVHDYRLEITPEDRRLLGLDLVAELRIGWEVGCFVIVTVDSSGEPTANLAAPLVVNLANRQCLQSYQADSDYSFRHLLAGSRESVAAC